jgi:diguanylate cyclase (GGDEF)-like protein
MLWAFSAFDTATLRLLQNLLVPAMLVHLLLFLFLKERGLFTLWGALRVLLVAAETGALVYLLHQGAPQLSTWEEFIIFDGTIRAQLPFWDLSIPVALFGLILFVLLAYMHHHVIYYTAFFGIYLFTLIALYYGADTGHATLSLLGIIVIVFGILLKESYRLAFYDELTGLPGRRALMESMAKLGRSYCLAMVDIDHFKKFNDTYGHDTGDDVLKMVAARLEAVGGGGKAYRYGGEEFTVLFPSKSIEHSFEQMEAVRQAIAGAPFRIRHQQGKKSQLKEVRIHISSGVVAKGNGDKDPMMTMKRADNALYKAKKMGRNRVIKA